MVRFTINGDMITKDRKNVKFKRVLGLLIDEIIWYLIYFFCLIVTYLIYKGSPQVTGDAMYYKLQLDEVITSKFFISFYLIVLFIYESIIPTFNKGKTLSKKILGLYINCKSNGAASLAIRSIVKLVILNPYGIVAYLFYNITQVFNSNIYSNVLILIFIICGIIVAVRNEGKGFHDLVAGTAVYSEK